MGYQPRTRTPRDFGRRHGRAAPKPKAGKRRPSGLYKLDEEYAPTSQEIVDRTLNSLNRLGDQRFAVAPFYEHFDRWLLSLRTILHEFQSNPAVAVDAQFTDESSRILSDVERALNERRLQEASHEEAIRRINQNLLDARSLLAQTERQYVIQTRELSEKKERALKPLASRIRKLGEELNRIVRIRAGFLRSISRKTKAQKEEEATQTLDSTKRELTKIERSFAVEQTKLQDEYERRKQYILKQIVKHQKDIENLETGGQTDDVLETRRAACDALINVVNLFLQRTRPAPETTEPSR